MGLSVTSPCAGSPVCTTVRRARLLSTPRRPVHDPRVGHELRCEGGGGRCTAHVTSLGSCQTQTSTTSSTLNPDQLAGSTAARTEREEALALTAAEYSAMKRRGQLPSAGKGRRCSGEGEGGVGVAGSPGPASRQRYKPSVDVTLP